MASQPLIKLTFVAPPELLFEDKDILETVKTELKKRNVEIILENREVLPNSMGAEVLHQLVTTPTWEIASATIEVFAMLNTVGHISIKVVEVVKEILAREPQEPKEYTITLKSANAPDSASSVSEG